MRVGDELYWAPEIPFSALVLGGPQLGAQYEARMSGYYLTPAAVCCAKEFAFAAGLLVVAALDAMARMHFGRRLPRQVNQEFEEFVQLYLPSFGDAQHARILYADFRNGLVHEARIKNGGEFRLDAEGTFTYNGSRATVNPSCLLAETRNVLQSIGRRIGSSETVRLAYAEAIRQEFQVELEG